MPKPPSLTNNSRALWILRALDAAPDGTSLGAVAIARAVESVSLGGRVPPGSLYNILTQLSAAGLITSQEDHRKTRKNRKTYTISHAGRNELNKLGDAAFPWPTGHEIIGNRARYAVVRALPYEGFGVMFEGRVVKVMDGSELPAWVVPGATVMIKAPRPSLRLPDESARYLTLIEHAVETEVQTLRALTGLNHIVETVDWGEAVVRLRVDARHTEIPAKLWFLVQPRFAECPNLRVWFKEHAAAGPGAPSGAAVPPNLDTGRWFRWAEALVTGLRSVHTTGTVHRDIRPSNIVIANNEPTFVDLGEAVFGKIAPPVDAAARPASPRRYTAPEQRGDSIQPSRRADLFSLGGVLFFMATGKDPEFLAGSEEALKEEVARAIVAARGPLPSSLVIGDIVSRCLCADPAQRIQSADELLQEVRLGAGPERSAAVDAKKTVELVERLQRRQDPVFLSLAAVQLDELNDRLEMMSTLGVAIIEGDHDQVVRKMTTYLSTLGRGHRYYAVTLPQFWWSQNLGIRGAFLTEHIALVARGGIVHRTFLMTEGDRFDPLVHKIVRAQLEMERTCRQLKSDGKGRIETRFVEVDAGQREKVIRRGEQRGLWISESSVVSLTPTYDNHGVIRAVTLKRIDGVKAQNLARTQFDELFRRAQPLAAWAGGTQG